MKILYTGYYGFKNSGDDAFIEVSAWGAKKYWNVSNPVFLGSNLPETIYDKKAIKKPLFKGHERVQTFIHGLNSDYFISAGGSTFTDHSPYSLKDIAHIVKKRLNSKLKIGAIGVSIGPFKNVESEKKVIDVLQKMDFLALRDKRSYDYARAQQLPYAPVEAFDLAALLPDVYASLPVPGKSKSKKIIGISVCNYERYIKGDLSREEARNKYLLDLISSLPYNNNVLYRFFIFNGNPGIGDQELTEFMTSKLPGRKIEIVPYLHNVKKTWDNIAECDLVISTRLHASIFACYANIPFFLMEYHRKCTDFLIDVGQNERYRLHDGEGSISEIQKEIISILETGSYHAPTNIKETIEKSRRNFTQTIVS